VTVEAAGSAAAAFTLAEPRARRGTIMRAATLKTLLVAAS
jgi:hypothetical protein